MLSYDIVVEIKSLTQLLGVYYRGEIMDDHDIYRLKSPEHFLRKIEPNESGLEAVHFESSLLIRTSDFKTRILLEFYAAPDDIYETGGNRYQINFRNLAIGDRTGDMPVELKHGEFENV